MTYKIKDHYPSRKAETLCHIKFVKNYSIKYQKDIKKQSKDPSVLFDKILYPTENILILLIYNLYNTHYYKFG